MFFGAKEKTIHINGMTADYITFGKGKKNLIMIQGLNTKGIKGSGMMLAYMYRIFAKDYTVYLFDRRNGDITGITSRHMAMDIASAMDSLNIKNADVFGVSQGGIIAQYLCIDRSDLVNKAVFALTFSKDNETVADAINHWITLTEKGDYKSLVTDMAEKMYSEKYLKKYKIFLPLIAAVQKPKNPVRFINLAKACLGINTYDELYKITCPVFVIGAKEDKIVGGDASYEMAEKLRCEIYMYDNLGHAAYEEAKDFNRRVYDFFSEK